MPKQSQSREGTLQTSAMTCCIAPWSILAGVGILLPGCSIPIQRRDGSERALILGIGLVQTSAKQGVSVQDLGVLGLVAAPKLASLGVARSYTIEVDPYQASNMVVGIRITPELKAAERITIKATVPSQQNP